MKPTETLLGGWVGGINSLLHPTLIPKTQYHWAENVINRGGVVQTRPGYALRLNLPGKKLQGLTSFQQLGGIPYLVFAIDGLIYASQYPFDDVEQLEGLEFSAEAEMVFFETCIQSVKRNASGNLEIIKPKRVLIIQDGVTRGAKWDGSEAKHVNPEPPEYGPPVGTWMKWVASRLWIISGSQVVVSDYADPTSFNDRTYLAEQPSFQLPDEGTGLLVTPDQKNLLAFTRYSTTSFQASIRQRNLWQLTLNFQQELIPDIGCVSGRSCTNQFGRSWWYAEHGLIDLNTALFSQRDSKLKYVDNEMNRSKRNISHNTHSIASAYYDNLLLVSVPSGSMNNGHTWVLDGAVIDIPGEDAKAWASVWTGIEPVQWASLNISGDRKLYAGCQGVTQFEGNVIQIWEIMRDDFLDKENPISCQFETRSVLIDGQFHKFNFAEFDLVEILGDVHLKAWFAGVKGGYEQILDVKLQAEKGSIGGIKQQILYLNTLLQAYRPQTRVIRSKESSPIVPSENMEGSCSAESKRVFTVDQAFSILMEWSGKMGVRSIKMVTEAQPATNTKGECATDEDGHSILTEEGKSEHISA